ncbi:acyl-CoA dehydrogenase family protein [Rhodococcus sp. NPDC127530]|uniref:acyl-CoA dehydrogenase family protein n=1 Tax=unclassified Rhodococcus (in: high G+C Gram-positive bacteria) TaxID=192944 RepID=UPI00362E55D0
MTVASALRTYDPAVLPAVTAALAERAADYDRTGRFPAESIAVLHDAGILTSTVGRRFGGAELGHAGTFELMLALGEGDPSVALITAMTLAFHARQATEDALPTALYRSVLDDSAAEPTLLNALQVEPALGTPSRGGAPATTARRVPGGWKVTGHKIYSTGAAGLRWMIVMATTDEPEPRVGNFAVDARSGGIGIDETWDNTGMRATGSHGVLFDEVFVPDEFAFGLQEVAHRRPQDQNLGPGTTLPAIYLGVARAARSWFLRFLDSRRPANLGTSLLELPRFEAALGEIDVQLTASITLLRALAEQADRGEAVPKDVAWSAKTVANRAAIGAVEHMVRLIGNPGLSRSNPLERYLRDVYSSRIHFPQEDTVTAFLGKAAKASIVPSSTPITSEKS